MKMNLKSFVSGIIVGSVMFSGIALAAPNAVKMFVNGLEIHSDVPPQIIDGRTLIPARALAEALGARVSWDEASQKVTIEDEKYLHLQLKNADISAHVAEGLAADAYRHFWTMKNGGDGDRKDGTFPYKDADYRWMASDLDTKTKFIEYFELLFTPEQVQAYWKKLTEYGGIVEIDGKLAQPNADSGSLMEWANATAKLIQDGKTSKTFKFSVPISGDIEEKEVKVKFVEGKGWRIDEPVDTIR